MITKLDERIRKQSSLDVAAVTATIMPSRSVSIDYLRAFVVFLVVAFHSAEAYLPGAPAPAEHFVGGLEVWRTLPVVDGQRSDLAAIFFLINNTFFMTLMFFVSGLFVWRSLGRKGSVSFLRDRLLRLGVPFLFAAIVIPPIAHFASYLQTSDEPTFGAYWRAWWALSDRPIGPVWFNGMLLVFDFTAVGLLAFAPKWGERIGALASRGDERPARFFAIVLILSALAYVPLALAYGVGTWTQWGLIAFQTSRPAHYFVYFIMGVAVGVHGLRKGLLSHDGALARRWWIWALAAAGCGGLVVFLAVASMTSKGPEQSVLVFAGDLAFAPICATLSFALLAVFTRFVQRSNPMVDSLAANSYGIYIVHYAFVAWLQFALLHASLSGTEKWGLVAFGAYATSWFATAAARRLPGVARII